MNTVVENTSALKNIETFGAGVIALLFVFVLLGVLLWQGIPLLRTIGTSIVKAVEDMGAVMATLNKTMLDTQAASNAAMVALEKRVQAMELKLDYHIDTAGRIETQVNTLGVNTSEIKERVRGCANQREMTLRAREEDKLG